MPERLMEATMHFKPSLFDDSEPEYAPCLAVRKKKYLYWVAPKKYQQAGCPIKSMRLEGEIGDGCDIARAQHCRALTRDMIDWFEGVRTGKKSGTWGWLIGRYLSDPYSDFGSVRPQTREGYRKVLARIEGAIGEVLLAETDYTRLMEWQRMMRTNGRSDSYIKKWFTHLGLALSHGVKIEADHCQRIATVRSKMRISGGTNREVFATYDQVRAIVSAADAKGMPHISLAILLRFELALRGTDVYGQWEPAEGRKGGIQHNGKLWVDGITWDMIDPDVMRIVKVISKTRKSMPAPQRFDLDQLPGIRKRLLDLPSRVGPVIICPDGMPPRSDLVTKTFKRLVRELGLPEDLQLRDTRSGAITEAAGVADPYMVRNMAQHTQMGTTDRYVRARDNDTSAVIQLRQKGRK